MFDKEGIKISLEKEEEKAFPSCLTELKVV